MKNNNVTNISFKSNIRFIPYKEYEKLSTIPKTDIVKEMWDIDSVCQIKDYGATKDVKYCLAGVLKNLTTKKDFLFHWYPTKLYESFGFGAPKDNLIKINTKLKEVIKHNQLKGFIIGGFSKNCDNKHNHYYLGEKSELSKKLLKFLQRPFKLKNRKNFTIFSGQNPEDKWLPESAFVYSKQNDTYYVNSKCYMDYGSGDLLDKDKIRKHFDLIHVADDDKVFIGLDSQEAIPKEFWKKRIIWKIG